MLGLVHNQKNIIINQICFTDTDRIFVLAETDTQNIFFVKCHKVFTQLFHRRDENDLIQDGCRS